MKSKEKLEKYYHNKETSTPEQDWEKFKMMHTGKTGKHGTEHWIKQYELVLKQYPNMRIYGWHKAIKWYCEYHGMEYERPHFQPDLYLVCSEIIVGIEIEDHSRWSKDKQSSMLHWYLEMDAEKEISFYLYRFDGYGNFQNVIFPNAEEELEKIDDCPIEYRKRFENIALHSLYMEQETLLDIRY